MNNNNNNNNNNENIVIRQLILNRPAVYSRQASYLSCYRN